MVAQIVGIKEVGLEDNFIELGGDSIKAILLLSRLGKKGYTLPVEAILGFHNLKVVSEKLILKEGEFPLVSSILSEEKAAITTPNINLAADKEHSDYRHHAGHINNRGSEDNQDNTTTLSKPGSQGWIDTDIPDKELRFIHSTYGENTVESIYPLTPMQKSILAQCVMKTPDTLNANFQTTDDYILYNQFKIKGPFDPKKFETRVHEITQKHEVLRTAFINHGLGSPLQAIIKNRKPVFSYTNLVNNSKQKEFINEKLVLLKQKDLDLSQDSLFTVLCFKISDSEMNVLISWHHLILDGWSLSILFDELFSEYPLKDLQTNAFYDKPIPFSAHLKLFKTQNKTESEKWWKENIREINKETRIFEIEKKDDVDFKIKTKHFDLGDDISKLFFEISKKERIPLSALLQAAWAILLSKYNNTEKITFANVTSGRLHEVEGFEKLVGMCVTTLPVTAECSENQTFIKLSKKIHTWNLEANHYGNVEPGFIKNLVGESYADHLFVIENQARVDTDNNELSSKISISQENVDSGHTGIPFAVEWNIGPSLGCLFHYNKERYEDWQVDGLHIPMIRLTKKQMHFAFFYKKKALLQGHL